MSAIVSDEYAKVVDRLTQDRLIQHMAGQIRTRKTPITDYAHDDGQPRFEFMAAANHQYHDVLGGTVFGHLGAVATAVLRLAFHTSPKQWRVEFSDLPDERFEAVTASELGIRVREHVARVTNLDAASLSAWLHLTKGVIRDGDRREVATFAFDDES